MAKQRTAISRERLEQIVTEANVSPDMTAEAMQFLALSLDWYSYGRDAKTKTLTRAEVRSSLETLILTSKKLLSDINKNSWIRSGLERSGNLHEKLMYRAGSRTAEEMFKEAMFGLTWLQDAASVWLDHQALIERKHPDPSVVRGSPANELSENLIWFWQSQLQRKIVVSDSSSLTKFIVACFDAAGTKRSSSAIRKYIQRRTDQSNEAGGRRVVHQQGTSRRRREP